MPNSPSGGSLDMNKVVTRSSVSGAVTSLALSRCICRRSLVCWSSADCASAVGLPAGMDWSASRRMVSRLPTASMLLSWKLLISVAVKYLVVCY